VSTKKSSKIKTLLANHKPGIVMLAKHLERIGISRDLQQRYLKNGWLQSVGSGAFKLPSDTVHWEGGLYALQQQAHLPIHAGGLTAITFQGLEHYGRSSTAPVFLFSPLNTIMPRWFGNFSWESPIVYVKTSILPQGQELFPYNVGNFEINISSPERAILECLYLAPNKMDLVECFHLMEGLSALRPNIVQELLEKCSSVKVKRLFLFMATKANHRWLNFVDLKKIDLGSGDRSIAKNGVYDSRFHISVPKELAA
jgi:hypothetical protein